MSELIQNTQPIYTHDCDKCKFVGQKLHEGKMKDLYICGTSGIYGYADYIVRHSDMPSDYSCRPIKRGETFPPHIQPPLISFLLFDWTVFNQFIEPNQN